MFLTNAPEKGFGRTAGSESGKIKAATQVVSSRKPSGVSNNEILWAQSCGGASTPWCPPWGCGAAGPHCDETPCFPGLLQSRRQRGWNREYDNATKPADSTEIGLFFFSEDSQNRCKPLVNFSELILTLLVSFLHAFMEERIQNLQRKRLIMHFVA